MNHFRYSCMGKGVPRPMIYITISPKNLSPIQHIPRFLLTLPYNILSIPRCQTRPNPTFYAICVMTSLLILLTNGGPIGIVNGD